VLSPYTIWGLGCTIAVRSWATRHVSCLMIYLHAARGGLLISRRQGGCSRAARSLEVWALPLANDRARVHESSCPLALRATRTAKVANTPSGLTERQRNRCLAGAAFGDPAAAGGRPGAGAPAGTQQQQQQQGQGQQREKQGKKGKPAPPPDDRNFLQKNWIFMVPVGLLVRHFLSQGKVDSNWSFLIHSCCSEAE